MKYNIQIFDNGSMMEAISAASICAKALNVENIQVVSRAKDCDVFVSHDSRITDIYEIYQLKVKLAEKKP